MNNAPEVSVIMPVYNGERYLKEAMESVLRQTFTDFELIMVIDGSTDRSADIVASFSDSRIACLHNEKNNGLVASLNRGLSVARGRFIARMDSDDICMPDRLDAQVACLRADAQVLLVSTDYIQFGGSRETQHTICSESDCLKTFLLFSSCFSHPTVMMRNVFRDSSLGYEAEFVHTEDYRLWTVLAVRGEFRNIRMPLLRYRVHASQVTQQHRESQLRVSRKVRADYLAALGFTFTEEQLRIHNFIGDHRFSTSVKELQDAERWLTELIRQNSLVKALDPLQFGNVIRKIWLDTCGNSNLFLRGYFIATRSSLVSGRLTLAARVKLLAKLSVRVFKAAGAPQRQQSPPPSASN